MKKIILIFVIFISVMSVSNAQSQTSLRKFTDEVVKSKRSYPKSYEGPMDINYQIVLIADEFGLDPTDALKFAKNLPALPEGAEGWFAVPKLSAVAKENFPGVTDHELQYTAALRLVFIKIETTRPFAVYLEGKNPFENISQTFRTLLFLREIEEDQSGDILIIAAQCGKLHRGESSRKTVQEFTGNEFGLSTFQVACIALVHPELYSRPNALNVNCVGDEYLSNMEDGFFATTCLLCYDGEMQLDFNRQTTPLKNYGSGTAFVPYP
jgi:hypothetical protein